jgi:hypothetical protein
MEPDRRIIDVTETDGLDATIRGAERTAGLPRDPIRDPGRDALQYPLMP